MQVEAHHFELKVIRLEASEGNSKKCLIEEFVLAWASSFP